MTWPCGGTRMAATLSLAWSCWRSCSRRGPLQRDGLRRQPNDARDRQLAWLWGGRRVTSCGSSRGRHLLAAAASRSASWRPFAVTRVPFSLLYASRRHGLRHLRPRLAPARGRPPPRLLRPGAAARRRSTRWRHCVRVNHGLRVSELRIADCGVNDVDSIHGQARERHD